MHSVNVLNYLILKFNRMKLMIQCGILSYDSFAILTVPLQQIIDLTYSLHSTYQVCGMYLFCVCMYI